MIQQTMAGLLISVSIAALRLYRGRPSGSDEWSELLYLMVVGFINGFMIAHLAPLYPAFAAKFTFHLFLYLLLASTSILFYLAYRASYDLKALAAALAPWYLALLLMAYSAVAGTGTVFAF